MFRTKMSELTNSCPKDKYKFKLQSIDLFKVRLDKFWAQQE